MCILILPVKEEIHEKHPYCCPHHDFVAHILLANVYPDCMEVRESPVISIFFYS